MNRLKQAQMRGVGEGQQFVRKNNGRHYPSPRCELLKVSSDHKTENQGWNDTDQFQMLRPVVGSGRGRRDSD